MKFTTIKMYLAKIHYSYANAETEKVTDLCYQKFFTSK